MSVNVGSITLDKWSEGIQNELRNFNDVQLQAVFNKYVYSYLLPRIKEHTPVSSGERHPPGYVHAKDAWHVGIYATGNNSFLKISNDKEDYAQFLEFGSVPGEKPWPSAGNIIKIYADEVGKAGPGKTKVRIRGRLLKKSGKTYYGADSAGAVRGHFPGEERVWAGGLFPGGTLSKGGAITRAHFALQKELGIGNLVNKINFGTPGPSPSPSPGPGPGKNGGVSGDLEGIAKAGILRRATKVIMGGVSVFAKAVVGDLSGVADALWKRFSGR